MTTSRRSGITASGRLASMGLSSRRTADEAVQMAKSAAKPLSRTGASLSGILPVQAIRRLIAAGHVRLGAPMADDQLQPASLDLRLGTRAYRVRASFLPGPGRAVSDKLADLQLHAIDLEPGAVLETGCVYLAPL